MGKQMRYSTNARRLLQAEEKEQNFSAFSKVYFKHYFLFIYFKNCEGFFSSLLILKGLPSIS